MKKTVIKNFLLSLTIITCSLFSACDNPWMTEVLSPFYDLSGTLTVTPETGGHGTEFTAHYDGPEPVTFQWNLNRSIIPGARSDRFTANANGNYTVTVRSPGFRDLTSNQIGIGLPGQSGFYIENPGYKTYGDSSFTLSSSGGQTQGAVTYSIVDENNVISLNGSTVTILNAGTVIIRAIKAGNNSYGPAEDYIMLTVNPRNITITPNALNKQYGAEDPEFTYTVNPQLLQGDNFTGALSRVEGEVPDEYEILIGTLSAGDNYVIHLNSVNFTIVSESSDSFPELDPYNLTYSPGLILANIDLPPGYAWDNPNTTLDAGNNQAIPATYTESQSHTPVYGIIVLNIDKATPEVIWPVITQNAVYGQTLSQITIPASSGYASFNGVNVPGIFSWTYLSTYVGGAGTQTHIMAFTPDSSNYNERINYAISVTVNPRNITVTPNALNKQYGAEDPEFTYTVNPQLLTGDSFTGALSRFEGEDIGNYEILIGTLSAGDNYLIHLNNVNFNILPESSDSFPELDPYNLTYSPGLTLANIDLPPGYAWDNPNTTLDAGNNQFFAATYTESQDHDPENGFIFLNIAKATLTVTWPVITQSAVYGQTLSQINIPNTGSASFNGVNVPGIFSWTYLSTYVGGAGTRTHSMTFTPNNFTNYNNEINNAISVTVNPIQITGVDIYITEPVTGQIPASTVNNLNMTPQGSATISSIAWLLNGNEISGSSPFQSGQTYAVRIELTRVNENYTFMTGSSSSLTISNINDGSASTTVTADKATLTYTFLPTTVQTITIHSQTTSPIGVTQGSISGNLSVNASINIGTISYQWYSNTQNNNTGGLQINGATSASFNIPTNLTENTYYYFCEVRGNLGATSVRSNVIMVNVTQEANPGQALFDITMELLENQAPDIVINAPISLSSNGITLNVTVAGTIRWLINGNIVGSTASIALTPAFLAQEGFDGLGTHYLSLEVDLAAGGTYSKTISFTLIP